MNSRDEVSSITKLALGMLQDGEFHNLHRMLDSVVVLELDLCRQRCEAEGKTFKDIRSIEKHGRRLLIQDAIDALPADKVVKRETAVTEYRLA